MCGITGYVTSDGTGADPLLLGRMAGAIAHRGPDSQGIWNDGEAGLAHRRLSIIDLDTGFQPMLSPDGRYVIVYNGELYNYRELKERELEDFSFKTASDTEVVLAAYCKWGTDCLKRFNGIFAFAIWDRLEKSLLLARDHFGVKPLYWTKTSSKFIFASEMKAILEADPTLACLDAHSLERLLTYRFSPSPDTLFRNVYKLRPAHFLTLKEGRITQERYFLRDKVTPASMKENEMIAETDAMLATSVKRQMVSDVPVGILLSGGVDSSLLADMAAKEYGRSLVAFTVGFNDRHRENEIGGARMFASHLGIRHEAVEVGAEDFLSVMDRIVYHMEEPVGTTSSVPLFFLCEKIGESHKVVLSGQGADEAWGGYLRHLGEKLAPLLRPLASLSLLEKSTSLLPRAERIKRAVYSMGERDPAKRLVKIYSIFGEELRAELLKAGSPDSLKPVEYFLAHTEGMDPLARMLFTDLRLQLPDDLLLYTDKMSMAHSVEVRVPFLDRELVAFVEGLPSDMKIKGLKRKYLFRKVAARHLPSFVLERAKLGFETPVDDWLRSEFRSAMPDLLCGSDSRTRHIFRNGAVKKLLSLHESGKENYSKQIFLLLSLELWARRFSVAF